MAIKIAMTLEGTEKIESQIDSVQKKGEDLNKSFNEIGKSGIGVDKIANDLKNAGLNFDQTSTKTKELSNSFKILSGSLRLLGVEGSGSLRALSAIFSRGGLLGLGAIATGVAAVKIGELEESFAKLQGQLQDTFGPQAPQVFNALQRSAETFGTTVKDLAPGLISFQHALENVASSAKGFVALRAEDLPGAIKIDQVTAAFDNFIKLLRAGRQTQAEAKQTADEFFASLERGGTVTSDMVKKLQPGTINLLKEAFGAAGLKSKEFFAVLDSGAISAERFAAVLAQFGPDAQKAFDTKAVKTMGDELGKTFQLAKEFVDIGLGRPKPFSDTFISALGAVNTGLQFIVDKFRQLEEIDANFKGQALLKLTNFVTTGPTLEQALGPDFVGPLQKGEDAAKKLGAGFIDVNQSLSKLGAQGVAAGNQVAQGANTAAGAYDKLKNSIDQTAVSQEDFKVGGKFGPQVASPFGQGIASPFGQATPSGQGGKFIPNTFFGDIQPQIDEVATQAGEEFANKMSEAIDEAPPPDFTNVAEGLTQVGPTVVQTAKSLWQQIQEVFNQAITFTVQGQASGGQIGGGGGSFPPIFAAGGAVRGPGSTTSDSIMAFLSNREWVINAKAVDFYGSSLFSALNSMRLPRSLLTGVPRMAEGGQVRQGASSLTLVLGGRTFQTTTSDETLTSLRRFAVHSQLASIGRKPGFVR